MLWEEMKTAERQSFTHFKERNSHNQKPITREKGLQSALKRNSHSDSSQRNTLEAGIRPKGVVLKEI